jgi:hypothetical protein
VLRANGFDPPLLERITIRRHFPYPRALLASVHELGASRVTARNRRTSLMGRCAWRRFADIFERMRTARGLPLTYEPYFFPGSSGRCVVLPHVNARCPTQMIVVILRNLIYVKSA